MGGAGHHCHCKASNFCPQAQVLPGAQTIKIPYVLSAVGKFISLQESATNLGQKCQRLPTGLNKKCLPGITKH